MSGTEFKSRTGKRLYRCDEPGCGLTREPWGETWLSWCSYKDMEEQPEKILTWCSIKCANAYIDAHPRCHIPRPTVLDLKSDLAKELSARWNEPLRSAK